MCLGYLNTDSRFSERIDNIIYFILFPKPRAGRYIE